MTTVAPSYTFTPDGSPAASKATDEHHNLLAAICDTQTRHLLHQLHLRGRHCLEVGAGAGSVAAWLATQVGPAGCVLATDLHPRPTVDHPRLKVIRHDIVAEPVPDGAWDLIHVRLLLQHLPERREILDRLVAALNSHGVLVVEDWDLTWSHGRVLSAPDTVATELFERFQDTLWHIFAEAGVDHAWASRVPQAMIEAGLQDVTAHIGCRSWAGGTAGTRLLAGDIGLLKDKLLDHGLSSEELDRVRELMADPTMVIRTPPMVSTIGYQPHSLRSRS